MDKLGLVQIELKVLRDLFQRIRDLEKEKLDSTWEKDKEQAQFRELIVSLDAENKVLKADAEEREKRIAEYLSATATMKMDLEKVLANYRFKVQEMTGNYEKLKKSWPEVMQGGHYLSELIVTGDYITQIIKNEIEGVNSNDSKEAFVSRLTQLVASWDVLRNSFKLAKDGEA